LGGVPGPEVSVFSTPTRGRKHKSLGGVTPGTGVIWPQERGGRSDPCLAGGEEVCGNPQKGLKGGVNHLKQMSGTQGREKCGLGL